MNMENMPPDVPIVPKKKGASLFLRIFLTFLVLALIILYAIAKDYPGMFAWSSGSCKWLYFFSGELQAKCILQVEFPGLL